MDLFPRTLARIPYLIRSIVFGVIMSVIIGILSAVMVPLMPQEDAAPGVGLILMGLLVFVVVIVSVVYAIMALTIPRIRSCGWSPWLALILLIPGAGGIFGLVLLFVPPVDSSLA